MCQVSNMSEFWRFQKLSIGEGYKFSGFTYFRKYDRLLNMNRNAIIEGFKRFQDSEYARFLGYARVTQGSEYAWIWLNNAWLNCADYSKVLHMVSQGFEYASGSKYARVTQGSEYAWISLIML